MNDPNFSYVIWERSLNNIIFFSYRKCISVIPIWTREISSKNLSAGKPPEFAYPSWSQRMRRSSSSWILRMVQPLPALPLRRSLQTQTL